MLTKDPESRINLSKIREHPWVTKNGVEPLPPTEENVVGFITVTAEEVQVKYPDNCRNSMESMEPEYFYGQHPKGTKVF